MATEHNAQESFIDLRWRNPLTMNTIVELAQLIQNFLKGKEFIMFVVKENSRGHAEIIPNVVLVPQPDSAAITITARHPRMEPVTEIYGTLVIHTSEGKFEYNTVLENEKFEPQTVRIGLRKNGLVISDQVFLGSSEGSVFETPVQQYRYFVIQRELTNGQ